jgi:hypothetical protein
MTCPLIVALLDWATEYVETQMVNNSRRRYSCFKGNSLAGWMKACHSVYGSHVYFFPRKFAPTVGRRGGTPEENYG